MASIVDTSVKHAYSSMAGAPAINGTAGSLIAALDAFLVTGWGSKSVDSAVISNGVCRLSFASGKSAAEIHSVIQVSGATPAGLNGEQRVTAVANGWVEFKTALPDGAVSGSISFKMAPAGWVKPFAGANLAVYQSQDPQSTRMFLHVDDTGSVSARVVGFESMTDVSSGAGAFPSLLQMPGGGYWAKSAQATAAPVNWVLFADSRKFILHIAPNTSVSANYSGGVTRGFGDDIHFRPSGDAYACSLSFANTSALGNQGAGGLDGSAVALQAMPRNYTGLGSSVLHVTAPFSGNSNTVSGMDSAFGAFPSPVDGSLRLTKKYLAESVQAAPRCELPGLFHVSQTSVFSTFKTGDIIPGTGTLAGRRLMALTPSLAYPDAPTAGSAGVSFVDVTGPWR
ncbi:MAG: hypothetical protein RSE32_03140 [Comamonas sp.]|uniref:hypothetical protein n=1 Tax=Comamonas sp. TaxID=34028 RepID=UPI002FC5B4C3